MAQATRIGIIGGGGPGQRHAEGIRTAGGCKLVAVADLIPDRRARLAGADAGVKAFADGLELIAASDLDLVVLAVPTDLHPHFAISAMKAGRHVVCEPPPATSSKGANKILAASRKHGRHVLYSMQRRHTGPAQASRQAIQKGYVGEPYHARGWILRPRAVPVGTGWYADPARSGGGVIRDLGANLFDLVWSMLGEPIPQTVFATSHRQLGLTSHADLEESATLLVRFANGTTAELAVAWALNQPAGEVCRISGTEGGIDMYTPSGPLLFRGFEPGGAFKSTPLKLPKTTGYAAFYRHARDVLAGQSTAMAGGEAGVILMNVLDAASRSLATGRSVEVAAPPKPAAPSPGEPSADQPSAPPRSRVSKSHIPTASAKIA